MNELNLSEIETKMKSLFSSGQRLVFWYDTDGHFEDTVGELQLGDVRLLRLTDRNAFRAKMVLEHEDPEGQYLVYAPFEKPEAGKNHLEDTLLYSRQFFADPLSLMAADLQMPERLAGSLSRMNLFFGTGKQKLTAVQKKEAARRMENFTQRAGDMDLETATEETLQMIAMCVVAGARNTTADDLLYAVLTKENVYRQDTVNQFTSLGLGESFWRLCENRFGYSDPNPSLLKLVLTLFAVDTWKDHLTNVPDSWKQYIQDGVKSRAGNVTILLENMKNNVLYQEAFDHLSQIAAQELRAAEVLSEVPREELLHMSSFLLVDDLLIRWMVRREVAEDLQASVSGLSIPDICRERLRLHFGKQRTAQYHVLLSGYSLLGGAAHYVPKETWKDLFEEYVNSDYQIDTDYRTFITNLDLMEDPSGFEKLTDLLENVYRQDFLEKNVYAWNNTYLSGRRQYVVTWQSAFYKLRVHGSREKVAVIISDAFRYEAAKQLCERMQADPNMNVTIEPMLTSLPSITMVGMAQLLPHDTITLTQEKTPQVFADGKPTASMAAREKILQTENRRSAAVDYDTFKQMKSKELRSFTAGEEVIYIYHNRIDATGEAMKNESRVFDATEQSMDEIFGMVRTLSRSGNVYRFLITADHGFIYTRRKLEETDKLDNVAGKDAFIDRRFIVDTEKHDMDGVYSVSLGEVLENDDPRFITLAKGMSVFKCSGGMNYVHGGASAQEMIVPCISVKTQRGRVETEDVMFALITDIRKVTSLKLQLDFYQEQPVSDVVKEAAYRIRFESGSGEVISNEILYTADSRSPKPGDRMVSLHFDIKRKKYSQDDQYFLKVYKEETGAQAASRQVIMDLPFMDE